MQDWTELGRTQVYERFGRGLAEVTYRLPSGQESVFVVRTERPTVTVLALTTDEQVVLTRQFRPGPGKVILEMPGGYLDPGEPGEVAAGRELLEETGYAGRLVHAGSSFQDSYSEVVKHSFLATGCSFISAGRLDPEEFIEIELVDLDRFRELLLQGEVADVDMAFMALAAAGHA